jgi:hypothetical protein
MEDNSLCISLSRKGEFPEKSITSVITTTFSVISNPPHCRSRESGNLSNQSCLNNNREIQFIGKYSHACCGSGNLRAGGFLYWFAVKNVSFAAQHKKSPLCNAGFFFYL